MRKSKAFPLHPARTKPAKKVGAAGVKRPSLTGPTGYLGHFAGSKVLADGHNTDKRVPGRPQPRHRSDDPILDEHLLRREGDRFNRDMDNIEAPMKTPGEIMRHRRQIRYIKT